MPIVPTARCLSALVVYIFPISACAGSGILDGRAEKSLQAQGVCVLQVGVCTSGKLRVSSGLAVASPVGDRGAPNALALNTTQEESKMSELAHAEIGKIHANTDHRQRAVRTIGAMQTSCIAAKRQQNPQRNCRGGVVGPWRRLVGQGRLSPRAHTLCDAVSFSWL